MAPSSKQAERREHRVLLRLDERELARFQKQAAREPLATWARRILLEHVERRERSAKGGKR